MLIVVNPPVHRRLAVATFRSLGDEVEGAGFAPQMLPCSVNPDVEDLYLIYRLGQLHETVQNRLVCFGIVRNISL